MSLGLLVGIVAAGILLVVFVVHRSGGSAQAAIDDAGAAIIEFGRAYPSQPIRHVILTQDRRAAFLRVADGRAGFVQAIGRHYLTRLIVPGSVNVGDAPDERTLNLQFRETTFKGGLFTFETAADAAEVSLWLVGTFVGGDDNGVTRIGAKRDA